MGHTKKKLVQLYAKKTWIWSQNIEINSDTIVHITESYGENTLKVYTDFTLEKNICIGTITVNKYSITKLKV